MFIIFIYCLFICSAAELHLDLREEQIEEQEQMHIHEGSNQSISQSINQLLVSV